MNLSEGDKRFLQTLAVLVGSKEVRIERAAKDGGDIVLLKGTYGRRMHRAFGMTRQGVRWRFQRMFNHAYVSAFETIAAIENVFGSQLRDDAIRIGRQRVEGWQRSTRAGGKDIGESIPVRCGNERALAVVETPTDSRRAEDDGGSAAAVPTARDGRIWES